MRKAKCINPEFKIIVMSDHRTHSDQTNNHIYPFSFNHLHSFERNKSRCLVSKPDAHKPTELYSLSSTRQVNQWKVPMRGPKYSSSANVSLVQAVSSQPWKDISHVENLMAHVIHRNIPCEATLLPAQSTLMSFH